MILSHKHYIEAETLILVTKTVTNLQNFVLHPEKHLVSITHEPKLAVIVWRDRMKRNPYGSDGLVRLRVCGRAMFSPNQWYDVDSIWHDLVHLCVAYIETRKAHVIIAGLELEISMHNEKNNIARLTFGSNHILVEVKQFIAELLSAALEYFTWVHDCVGVNRSDALKDIDSAYGRLNSL